MWEAASRIVLTTTLPSSLHRPASLLRRTMNLTIIRISLIDNDGDNSDNARGEPVPPKPGNGSWSAVEQFPHETSSKNDDFNDGGDSFILPSIFWKIKKAPGKNLLVWRQLICPPLSGNKLRSKQTDGQLQKENVGEHKKKIVSPDPGRKRVERLKEIGSIWKSSCQLTHQR